MRGADHRAGDAGRHEVGPIPAVALEDLRIRGERAWRELPFEHRQVFA
jgi:hypothetical protein